MAGIYLRPLSRTDTWAANRGLCRLSAHEEDILQGSGLAWMWPGYSTRKSALDSLAR
jgi:hypothetical protein